MVRKTRVVFLTMRQGVIKVMQVNNLEAKTNFSRLILLLETKKEDFIIVARNGKPISEITLINETPVSDRIGSAKGKFTMKCDFDADNDAIAELMMEGIL